MSSFLYSPIFVSDFFQFHHSLPRAKKDRHPEPPRKTLTDLWFPVMIIIQSIPNGTFLLDDKKGGDCPKEMKELFFPNVP